MDLNTLKEYLKIHIISLKQDREWSEGHFNSTDYIYLSGQIAASNEILELIDEH